MCPTVNSHNPTSQKNYAPQTSITATPLPCLTGDNNESNIMENTFPSIDSSDLIRTLWEDSERVLSDNLSASLHLTENSAPGNSVQEIVVQDSINMSDSFDRIADNTLKEFCETYTKRN